MKIECDKVAMITLLERLANINSSSTNPEGLKQCCKVLVEEFSQLGAELKTHTLEKTKFLNSNGLADTLEGSKLIHIRKERVRKKRILLVGHYDTVHSKDSPFQKCTLDKENDTLKGPGALDMKGGLVIMLHALKIFESSPLARELSWEVCLVPDEEIGSPASTVFLKECAKRADIGLVFEPSLEDGSLASARKGSANLTLGCKGKPAHAGRNPEDGISAIYALSEIALYLEKMGSGEFSVNVGTIYGGGKLNVVPEYAKLAFNIRFETKEDFEKAQAFIHLKNTFMKKKRGVETTFEVNSYRPPKPFNSHTKILFEKLKKCATKLNINLHWQPVGGVCDGNTLASFNVPTIDTLGVVGTGIHTEEETVFLESLTERTKLTVLLLMSLAEEK